MRIEFADCSLVGHREENQDRAAIEVGEQSVLLIAMDGMGGHAEGALAAETAREVLRSEFRRLRQPLFDPAGFLHLALGKAHAEVVAVGAQLPIELRPRATCAVCLVQRGEAWWAHIGDSRVYHLREGGIVSRTRDHSHVEQLLREGAIREDEIAGHPLRNFVECCLGGEHALPEMSVSCRRVLEPGDQLLVCTDGLWANLKDTDIAAFRKSGNGGFREALESLAKKAVEASAPHSDNASVAGLCWLG